MATDMHRGPWEADVEVPDLAEFARQRGVKYFLISYTDLFGGQRAKLVPAQAIGNMAVDGAGFAGFATWLDLTPAHADLMAIPDPTSAIQLPWKPEVAWVAAHATMEGALVDQAPRNVQRRRRGGEGRAAGQDRGGARVLPADARREHRLRPL